MLALGQVKTVSNQAASASSIKANRNGNFNNTEFINLIRDMMYRRHTEELDKLLDLYKII
jgi:hypothetical protein